MPRGRRPRIVLATLVAASALALALPLSGASGEESRPQSRIVGGTTTTIAEWPWQIALLDTLPFRRQICGGSLIAPDLVVTAAHCVHDGVTFDPPARYEVLSGSTTISGAAGAIIDVSQINYFTGDPNAPSLAPFPALPLYQPVDDSWDAVVLELAGDAPAPAAPIRIAGPDEAATWAPGADAAITGWGATRDGGSGTNTLREAAIKMLSDSTCESSYEPEGIEYDPQTMVCAGLVAGGRDSCQGDSGGPLVVPLEGGGFRLVGDTSFGVGCGDPGFPGVYGRLADNPMRGAIATFASLRGENVIGSGGRPGTFTQSPGAASPPTPTTVDPTPTPRCIVPGLRTRTVPGARRALRRRSCRLGQVTRSASGRFRRGRVMRQRPPRGTERREGFRVRVVVSSGRR